MITVNVSRRPARHLILVVPFPLQSPPSAGEQRATAGVAVEREEATAEPPAAVPKPKQMPMGSCRIAANLPDEILVWEIFVRLPAKDILRCRVVCRSWRDLTSAEKFLLAHHQRQPSLPLVALNAGREYGLSISAAPARCSPPILGFNDYICWKLHASCDGLLLLSNSNGSFTICNPATRQCAPLTGLTRAGNAGYINIAALYLHRPSGDYRILYWQRHPHAAYYILNVRQGRSRRIGIPATSSDMMKVMRKEDGMISKTWDPPVLLRNCLHWNPAHFDSPYDAAGIVIFDIVAESFKFMPGPAGAITTTSRYTSLHDMDGSIGLSCRDDTSGVVKLWVLEDYEEEVWSLKYQIELPSRNVHRLPYARHMVLPHDRNVLVCYYSESYSYMFRCNSNGKFLEDFMWGPWCTRITGYWFRESLVKHPFFPIKRGADRVTQPHFFQKL